MAETATAESTAQEASPAVSAEDVARLQSELATFKAREKEKRENNIALLKERDELRARLEDLERANKQPGQTPQQQAQGAYDEAALKKLIKDATASYEDRLAAAEQRAQAAIEREREKDFEAQMGAAMAGLPKNLSFVQAALPDATARARREFIWNDQLNRWVRMKDGEVARRTDGEPIAIADWFAGELPKSAPHMFHTTVNGGGAAGGHGAGGARGIDPSLPPEERLRRAWAGK